MSWVGNPSITSTVGWQTGTTYERGLGNPPRTAGLLGRLHKTVHLRAACPVHKLDSRGRDGKIRSWFRPYPRFGNASLDVVTARQTPPGERY